MHTAWYWIIRWICAVHFHVSPHEIDEIYYWGPHADDVTHTWLYGGNGDCDLWTWGRYDVCIRHGTTPAG